MVGQRFQGFHFWVCAALLGCDGRVAVDPDEPAPSDATSTSGGAGSEPEGTPSEPDGGSEPEDTCSVAPVARRAELLWRRNVDYFYGLAGPGLLGYSPDGAQIVTPAD